MNIIILSYRISGNDGVSLECKHWKEILTRMGHRVRFLAGELDSPGILMPELHFQWPHVMDLHDKVVYGGGKLKQVEDKIFDVAGTIEGKIRKTFSRGHKVDLLIVANAFSIPMHFPLAIALKRVIEDFDIPTISRNHDFWWERKRFLKSRLFPFFQKWFPPNLPNMKHVVINSESQRQLKLRFGIDSTIIPDSFDFSVTKLLKKDSYAKSFKAEFGIMKDDIVFLQATRIIPRKRFEYSIKFMQKLNNPNALLVMAGHAGDEGREYKEQIKKLADEAGIRYMFIGDGVNSRRRVVMIPSAGKPGRKKIFTLWDCYLNSDFVLYPTKLEGFGNQLIEAFYFKKPVIMTAYPVFKADIAPLGFNVILMNERLTLGSVKKTRFLLNNSIKRNKMVDKNFELAKENFSYEATTRKIQNLLNQMI